MIHRIVVTNKVQHILVVLTRLLNNKTDLRLRMQYEEIEETKSPYFPIEMKDKENPELNKQASFVEPESFGLSKILTDII